MNFLFRKINSNDINRFKSILDLDGPTWKVEATNLLKGHTQNVAVDESGENFLVTLGLGDSGSNLVYYWFRLNGVSYFLEVNQYSRPDVVNFRWSDLESIELDHFSSALKLAFSVYGKWGIGIDPENDLFDSVDLKINIDGVIYE